MLLYIFFFKKSFYSIGMNFFGLGLFSDYATLSQIIASKKSFFLPYIGMYLQWYKIITVLYALFEQKIPHCGEHLYFDSYNSTRRIIPLTAIWRKCSILDKPWLKNRKNIEKILRLINLVHVPSYPSAQLEKTRGYLD